MSFVHDINDMIYIRLFVVVLSNQILSNNYNLHVWAPNYLILSEHHLFP